MATDRVEVRVRVEGESDGRQVRIRVRVRTKMRMREMLALVVRPLTPNSHCPASSGPRTHDRAEGVRGYVEGETAYAKIHQDESMPSSLN